MAFDYINEAFKKLELLDEQMFDTSLDGINKLTNFMDDDTDEVVRVIDPAAETDDDLQDSYIGKVIINCNICHSHVFENKEDVKIEEDGSVNIDMQCPYCGEQEGFTIVGEIKPYSEDATEEDEQPEEIEETNEALGIGAGLALGGAAIGAGMVGSALLDDVNDKNDELLNEGVVGTFDGADSPVGKRIGKHFGAVARNKIQDKLSEETDVDEGLLGDINVSLDASGSSVGFLGGTASTTNEDLQERAENKSVKMSRATKRNMTEDFKEVSITTEDQHMEMTSDENGKVTVTTEPITSEENTDSTEGMIAPVSAETEEEILNNNGVESEPAEDDFDFEFDEVDEESIDELGESYLRKVYENVKSFKTSSVAANDQALIVEGVITFNSGARKKTGFVFEAKDANVKGQVRFSGSNKQLAESVDAYSLVGRIDNKKLFVESLKYNYKVDEKFVRGIVRRK